MSTPEEFLRRYEMAQGVVDAMEPVYDLLGKVRDGFVEQGGFDKTTADVLALEWARSVMFPLITGGRAKDERE